MLHFLWADIRRQWAGALAVLAIVALATALGVVVTLQERALRLGSARAADAFDLVVGAPASETQLILSSVFLQPAPLPLMPGHVLADLIADPRTAWAAPIGFGDYAEGLPIVGTTQPLIDGLGGLAEGASFARLNQAVVGSAVGMEIGQRFQPVHGNLREGGHTHDALVYHVVGRMKPTGTPWDRALLVPIQAVWKIHGHEPHEEHEHEAADADHDHEHEHSAEEAAEDHDHDHAAEEGGHEQEHEDEHEDEHGGYDIGIDDDILLDPDAPGLPAILVKPKSIAAAYTLRQDYRAERTVAVFPGEVLTRLYGTLGDARRILAAVSVGAQALVVAAVLLVVMLHVLQRRRQIGALRAFGAPRPVIFALVWSESFLVIGAGLFAGFGLGYLATRILSQMLESESGVALPVGFLAQDAGRLGLLLLAVGLVAILPAILAYRQTPAAALKG